MGFLSSCLIIKKGGGGKIEKSQLRDIIHQTIHNIFNNEIKGYNGRRKQKKNRQKIIICIYYKKKEWGK